MYRVDSKVIDADRFGNIGLKASSRASRLIKEALPSRDCRNQDRISRLRRAKIRELSQSAFQQSIQNLLIKFFNNNFDNWK